MRRMVLDNVIDALQWAGMDLVFIAHNHCPDRGVAGLQKTMAYLDKIGLPYVGCNSIIVLKLWHPGIIIHNRIWTLTDRREWFKFGKRLHSSSIAGVKNNNSGSRDVVSDFCIDFCKPMADFLFELSFQLCYIIGVKKSAVYAENFYIIKLSRNCNGKQ